jgi:ApbE superfamily uncharacterized protein (UPF0280 family)
VAEDHRHGVHVRTGQASGSVSEGCATAPSIMRRQAAAAAAAAAIQWSRVSGFTGGAEERASLA